MDIFFTLQDKEKGKTVTNIAKPKSILSSLPIPKSPPQNLQYFLDTVKWNRHNEPIEHEAGPWHLYVKGRFSMSRTMKKLCSTQLFVIPSSLESNTDGSSSKFAFLDCIYIFILVVVVIIIIFTRRIIKYSATINFLEFRTRI